MTLLDHLLRGLLVPGLVAGLLFGGLLRGLAAWLGALIDRRPALPPWQPLVELVHLAGKAPPAKDRPAPIMAWPALLALAALCGALAMLPWPRWWGGETLPIGPVLYLTFLTVPPLARLAAAGLSASGPAALGGRRQAPLELARLLPVLLVGAALPLYAGQFTLAPTVAASVWSAVVGLGAAAIWLATLPWALWDQDTWEAPLAGLNGRVLALYRAVESLELSAHLGLVAVALRASGLFPVDQAAWAPLLAVAAGLVALTLWELSGSRPLLPEAARWYTRWLLPMAAVIVFVAWWFGS
jgi:formate hydrogenlyase subunit 4